EPGSGPPMTEPVDPVLTDSWALLGKLAAGFEPDLRAWFETDPGRVQRLTFDAVDLHVDLSKNLIDDTVLAALLALADDVGLVARFISNIDPTDAATKLSGLDPATTLFIVASKTFGTLETLTNARLCRTWLMENLPEADRSEAVARHFAAVSTALDKVAEFGI